MKKIPLVCLILAICFVFALPAPAVASGSASAVSGDSHIFLTNPVAITAIDDYVFVADNLESNHSVIFCFDVTGDAPVKIAEKEFSQRIVNIAELNGKLAVIFADKIVVYPLSAIIPVDSVNGGAAVAIVSEGEEGAGEEAGSGEETGSGEEITTPSEGGEGNEGEEGGETPNPDDGENGGEEGGETPTPPIEAGDDETEETKTYLVSGAVDVTYGTVQSNLGDGNTLDTISYISNTNAQYLTSSDWQDVFNPTVNAKAAVFFDGYFYYAFDGAVKRFNGMTDASDFNNKLTLASNFVPVGIFIYGTDGTRLALFDGNNAYRVDTIANGYTATATLFAEGNVDGNILDVCYAAGKLFVLNDNHRVEIFTANPSDNETFENSNVTIGTDTISIDTPTEFTGYTQAKSLGYPTNIIYKTDDPETSIENIVPDCKDEFTILDFEGAAELKYYYVMYGNKFGWIRKSVGATTPENDAKIQIVNNNVSTPVTKYTSHFTSLKGVFIYQLPVTSDSEQKAHFEQSIDNPVQFTFLQRFEEAKADGTTTIWFYVEYDCPEHNVTERGFIMDGTFGAISSKAEGEVPCKGQKINSSLFEAVKIYLTPDMTEGQEISDANGNVIKLYSGAYVEAIETKNGATYIQVRYKGELVRGWMPANNLIAPNRLTTNAIVGISLLSVAIALGVVLVAVFVHRRKYKDGKSRDKNADNAE